MLGGGPHFLVDHRLGIGLLEAFAHHRNLQAADALAQRGGVGLGAHLELARVVAIGAGDDFQQQRVVGHVGGHRADVVDGDLDRHHAGVGHQAVGRLHAVDAAKRRRHADRPTLVAADGHVGLAALHQHRAARRRATGRIAHAVRVVHRARGAGVAAARHAEVLAGGLAQHRAAGVQDALHQRGVDLGHVALHRRAAVHHRHASQQDVVFQHHRLADQLAGRRAAHRALDVPGVERVLFGRRPHAGGARVGHRGQVVGHPVDQVVGIDRALRQAQEGRHVGIGQRQVQSLGDALELLRGRKVDGHGGSGGMDGRQRWLSGLAGRG